MVLKCRLKTSKFSLAVLVILFVPGMEKLISLLCVGPQISFDSWYSSFKSPISAAFSNRLALSFHHLSFTSANFHLASLRASVDFPAAIHSATIASTSSLWSYTQYAALCFCGPMVSFAWQYSCCVASDQFSPDKFRAASVPVPWGLWDWIETSSHELEVPFKVLSHMLGLPKAYNAPN